MLIRAVLIVGLLNDVVEGNQWAPAAMREKVLQHPGDKCETMTLSLSSKTVVWNVQGPLNLTTGASQRTM